jgi:hypothetical protein
MAHVNLLFTCSVVTYMPYPFQIVQTPKHILMAYEYAGTARTIYMDKAPPSPADSWMGHSVGHWEGDTLVVDVTSMNDQTWFDRAGNFHSDALHVVERGGTTAAGGAGHWFAMNGGRTGTGGSGT